MEGKKGILERLKEGPVVGDGSMCMTLEKRGYCTAGRWTPEAVVEFPEAVLQLQREYVRAGADVVQTASFLSSDDRLQYGSGKETVIHTCASINRAACKIARQVANEGNALVCGGISPILTHDANFDHSTLREKYAKQVQVYETEDIDFLLAEFFKNIEEIEICAEAMKKLNKPIALSMALSVKGDDNGVSVEECAIRMAKTGAPIIGINCSYDINGHLAIIKLIKESLDREDLHPYIMCQPSGFMCPDIPHWDLPEFPLAIDPRVVTRIEVHKFTRAAWELGVRYIGGCCGFEPHHIRAIAQELAPERGRSPPCDKKCPAFGTHYKTYTNPKRRVMSTRDYWYGVEAGCGRGSHQVTTKTS